MSGGERDRENKREWRDGRRERERTRETEREREKERQRETERKRERGGREGQRVTHHQFPAFRCFLVQSDKKNWVKRHTPSDQVLLMYMSPHFRFGS